MSRGRRVRMVFPPSSDWQGAIHVLVAALLAVTFSVVAWPEAAHAEELAPMGRFDYAPYRVTVLMSFVQDPSVTPVWRQTVVATLSSRIASTFGAVWQFVPAEGVQQDDRLSPANEAGLERLSYEEGAQRLKDLPCDKAFFLAVRPQGPGWVIAGREWDATLQAIGPLATTTTLDRRGIGDASLALLQKLFSPLVIVDDADRDSKVATLTIRAGSIPLADSKLALLKSGDLLRPVFRFLDSKHNVRKIQPVPWTYLVLDRIENGHAKCLVTSTYRAPLAANMRNKRVEAIAVRIRADLPETQLKLVAGRTPPRPLSGLFVSLHTPSPEKNSPAPEVPKFLSDRHGVVRVPVDRGHILRMLEVHSGSTLLAKRPFVVGVEPEVMLEVLDDTLRLNAERDVDLLLGRLIETVARRAAFIGRIRAAAKKNDGATAQRLFDELEHLPAAAAYAEELNRIRVVALEDAERRKDRLAARRIGDLCQKSSAMIDQYLPDDRIPTFKQEIKELLKATAQQKPPEPEAKPQPRVVIRRPASETAPGGEKSAATKGNALLGPAKTEENNAAGSAAPKTAPVTKPAAAPGI